jgi:hypothetical protein
MLNGKGKARKQQNWNWWVGNRVGLVWTMLLQWQGILYLA